MPPTETPTGPVGWSQALGSNSAADAASLRRERTTNGATLRAATTRTDEQLARAAGHGDAAAFEALYERHHLALLSFARHMLARPHDAEDVVQHAFAAADRAFRSGTLPRSVRAWLFAVARNRCISMLRARREEPGLPDAGVPSTENLAAEVEQREDLRQLLADLRALPEQQRAALLLAELGELSHTEVAEVIGVKASKVKALVFQARETLLAAASARAIPCGSIREELAVATGAELRRRHLRHHLAQCPACRGYAARVRAQRASLALVLPVVPSVALREGVLAGLSGGAAATGAGAGVLAVKSTAAKLLTIAAVGGAAAGGGTVAVTSRDAPDRSRPAAERPAEHAPAARAPAAPAVAVAAPAAERATVRSGRRRDERAGRSRQARRERRATKPARVDRPPGHAKQPAASVPPGQAKQPSARTPPGQARKQARGAPPGQVRKESRGAPPGQVRKQSVTTPPGQARKQSVTTPPGQAGKAAPAPKPPKPPKPATPPPASAAPAEQPLPPGQQGKAADP